MEIDTYPAEKRVFRIDDECYIIYLGSDRDDYKPFLRVGNSKKLTKELISNIYNIVITESFTGNPALEPHNVNTDDIRDIRYVGDKATVDKFLNFLKNYKLETKNITYDQDIRIYNHNAVLYIYDDGNITLYYDENLLFDLKARAKKDLHFVEKTRWIKDRLIKNPLRYMVNDFKKPGFLLIKKCLFLYNQENFIAFNLPEDYFSSLAQSGIDPDLISAVVTDDAAPDFINLCKRKKFKKEDLNILSGNSRLLQSTLELFSTKGPDSLKFTLKELTATSKRTINGYTIKKIDTGFVITHKAVPYPIILGSKSISGSASYDEHPLLINPFNDLFIMPSGEKADSVKLSDCIPYTIFSKTPDENLIHEIYFRGLVSSFEGFFSAAESALVKCLVNFMENIEGEGNIQESLRKVKKGIRNIKPDPKSPLPFLLNNASAICSYFMIKEKDGNEIFRQLRDLKYSIKKYLSSADQTEKHFPLIGDCFLVPEGSFILYRLVKSTIIKEDYVFSEDTVQTVSERTKGNLLFYEEEISHLSELIGNLSTLSTVRKKTKQAQMEVGTEEKIKEGVSPEPETSGFTIGKTLTAQIKTKNLSRVLLILAGIIIVLGIVFFLPPLSLFQKSIRQMKEQKEVITGKEVVKEEAPGETGVSKQPEEDVITTLEQEALESFLSLGYIQITLHDVYKLTNKIAASNGYRTMDSIEQLGKDPDWIYPGNVFVFPDGVNYRVVKGDTIWYIAKRFIKKNLDRDWERHLTIIKEIDKNDISINTKKKLLAELESLREGSYSENFIQELDKKIDALK